MKMKIRLSLLCCSVLFLASCATTEIYKTWKDDSHTEKFTSVFVLALAKNPENRRILEQKLVNILKKAGVDAYATYDLFPNLELIDKDSTAAAMKEKGADGVFVLRLFGAPQEVKELVHEEMKLRYVNGWFDYYTDNRRNLRTIDYTIFTVESTIFDVETKKMVWTAKSDTSETSDAEAIDSYIRTIGQALKASGLY